MKAATLILLFAVCYVECRKVYAPINKNANVDFINMESGGARQPAVVPPPKPASAPAPVAPTTKPPVPNPAPKPAPVTAPVAKPPTLPPTVQPQRPVQPAPQPAQSPNQNKPVNPPAAAKPVTTPGPGSVKSLINYYDSQGQGSPIRPYSYSQAVKQG